MFTPTKIIFLIIVIAAIWGLFRLIERRSSGAGEDGGKKNASTVDLSQCDKCKNWVNAACGEADCPIKG